MDLCTPEKGAGEGSSLLLLSPLLLENQFDLILSSPSSTSSFLPAGPSLVTSRRQSFILPNMLPTLFFGSLAILSAVAPTLANPYPSTFQHLNIPRTTLTERAITVPVCVSCVDPTFLQRAALTLRPSTIQVKAKVEIPLGSVVNGLADSLRDDDNCGLLGLGCLVSDALTAVDNLLGGGKALNISLGASGFLRFASFREICTKLTWLLFSI